MTEHNENEETFDNEDTQHDENESAVDRELRENFEKIRERNDREYAESQDLDEGEPENDENEVVSEENSEEVLNREDTDKTVDDKAEETPEATEKTVDDYPSTWKGNLKEKWATIDPDVRAEIHRREGDMLKGLEQYRGYATYAAEVAKTFQPYDAVIKASGTNQKQVLESALNSMYVLKQGSPQEKAQELLNIAATYGVQLEDITSTNDKILANQPLVDPEVERLKQENQQILSYLEQSNIEKQQATMQTYEAELNEFATDPANKYFDEVREEMARIFASSQDELSLKEVYDNAVWANPVTREKLIAEQREAERRSAAEKAAAAKKTAKTNVASKGRHQAGDATTNGTLDDILRANFEKIRNRR
jgi:hypothetical protein